MGWCATASAHCSPEESPSRIGDVELEAPDNLLRVRLPRQSSTLPSSEELLVRRSDCLGLRIEGGRACSRAVVETCCSSTSLPSFKFSLRHVDCRRRSQNRPNRRLYSLVVVSVRASLPWKADAMLAYLAIFGAALAGLAGLPPWTMAASVIALASLSLAQHHRMYERAQEAGLTSFLDLVLFRSLLNAMVASGASYGGGCAIRLL